MTASRIDKPDQRIRRTNARRRIIDNLFKLKGKKIVGRAVRYLDWLHPLRWIPHQPIVLDAEIEKSVQTVMFPLHGRSTVSPRCAKLPEFRGYQFVQKLQRLGCRPAKKLLLKKSHALCGAGFG